MFGSTVGRHSPDTNVGSINSNSSSKLGQDEGQPTSMTTDRSRAQLHEGQNLSELEVAERERFQPMTENPSITGEGSTSRTPVGFGQTSTSEHLADSIQSDIPDVSQNKTELDRSDSSLTSWKRAPAPTSSPMRRHQFTSENSLRERARESNNSPSQAPVLGNDSERNDRTVQLHNTSHAQVSPSSSEQSRLDRSIVQQRSKPPEEYIEGVRSWPNCVEATSLVISSIVSGSDQTNPSIKKSNGEKDIPILESLPRSSYKNTEINHGLVRGDFTERENSADLHINPKGSGPGLQTSDMLKAVKELIQLKATRDKDLGPKTGAINLKPTGSAAVKLTVEMLAHAFCSKDELKAALKAQDARKKEFHKEKSGMKSDQMHKLVVPEHMHFIRALRGKGITMIPQITPINLQHRAKTREEATADMGDEDIAGLNQMKRYQAVLEDSSEEMSPGIKIKFNFDKLEEVAKFLEKVEGRKSMFNRFKFWS